MIYEGIDRNRPFWKYPGRFLPALLSAVLLFPGMPAAAGSAYPADEPAAVERDISAELVPQCIDDFYRTTYEVFVWSFCDSDGDGTGDLPGLISRLDYINDGDPATAEDLGCTALWLMPVFPSPTYHKYDVTDFREIDPVYGTAEDLDALLEACHERGMRVILDLPVNHTSSQHPWFRTAADYIRSLPEGAEPSAEECPEVDYYLFSRTFSDGYAQLPGTDWYYEARFWSEMPDLNLDSLSVREELKDTVNYWLDRGVDGFRLDAVTSYYTRDRQACIDFTGWLTETVKENHPEAYLVAEAWAAQNSYAKFYKSGIDSVFDFAFADREGWIARTAEGLKSPADWAEAMAQEEELYASLNPAYVNAPFYTNHDMARSAGYYPGDDGSRTKLAEAMNLLMTGNVFVYYGEELGMKGSGKDENKRAPMAWSADPRAEGMCAGPPEMEEQELPWGSWEEQKDDPGSVYAYIRQAIRLRESIPSIARGKTRVLPELSGEHTCGFLRESAEWGDVLILVNAGEDEAALALTGEAAAYTEPAAVLLAKDGEIRIDGERISLPGFGIAVLRRPADISGK